MYYFQCKNDGTNELIMNNLTNMVDCVYKLI